MFYPSRFCGGRTRSRKGLFVVSGTLDRWFFFVIPPPKSRYKPLKTIGLLWKDGKFLLALELYRSQRSYVACDPALECRRPKRVRVAAPRLEPIFTLTGASAPS
jgi:hypothetical protein